MSYNIRDGEHSANRYTRDHRLCDICRELKRLYQIEYRARKRKGTTSRTEKRINVARERVRVVAQRLASADELASPTTYQALRTELENARAMLDQAKRWAA